MLERQEFQIRALHAELKKQLGCDVVNFLNTFLKIIDGWKDDDQKDHEWKDHDRINHRKDHDWKDRRKRDHDDDNDNKNRDRNINIIDIDIDIKKKHDRKDRK